MLLSDTDIEQAMRRHGLRIEGMKEGAIGPASVDLMLSPHFWRLADADYTSMGMLGHVLMGGDVIDPRLDQSEVGEATTVQEGDAFILGPGEFVLASCVERFVFPRGLAGRVEGKSSLGRLGLMVHVTAGFFDPGFEGYPTLELVNVRKRPMLLWPGMPVAQMSVFEMQSPARIAYGEKGTSKYAGQGPKPGPSQYHRNFE